MAVGSNSQNLNIGRYFFKNGTVTGAFGRYVGCETVGNIYVFHIDIDFRKKVARHKIDVTFGMRGGKADVFVEIAGGYVFIRRAALFAVFYHFPIERKGG